MTINLRKQAKMCLDIFHLFTNCIFSTSIYDLVLTYIMFVNFFTIFLSIKSRTIKILVLESWIPASNNFWSKIRKFRGRAIFESKKFWYIEKLKRQSQFMNHPVHSIIKWTLYLRKFQSKQF